MDYRHDDIGVLEDEMLHLEHHRRVHRLPCSTRESRLTSFDAVDTDRCEALPLIKTEDQHTTARRIGKRRESRRNSLGKPTCSRLDLDLCEVTPLDPKILNDCLELSKVHDSNLQ